MKQNLRSVCLGLKKAKERAHVLFYILNHGKARF